VIEISRHGRPYARLGPPAPVGEDQGAVIASASGPRILARDSANRIAS
jgi:hypothetical protein